MTSHEFAKQLQSTAEFLLNRDSFKLDTKPEVVLYFFGEKELFLAAAKAVGSGQKEVDSNYVNFRPNGTILRLLVNRDLVCRKVQEEKWECEPLLSQAEEAQVG
jgi:hypothetical protein